MYRRAVRITRLTASLLAVGGSIATSAVVKQYCIGWRNAKTAMHSAAYKNLPLAVEFPAAMMSHGATREGNN